MEGTARMHNDMAALAARLGMGIGSIPVATTVFGMPISELAIVVAALSSFGSFLVAVVLAIRNNKK
jgi:hypothetical protein